MWQYFVPCLSYNSKDYHLPLPGQVLVGAKIIQMFFAVDTYEEFTVLFTSLRSSKGHKERHES